MKSSYAVAYSNPDGNDFNGIPWILDDINNEEECILTSQRLMQDGFKNVIPFQFEARRKKNEEFDWNYVREHQISIN